MNDFYEGDLAYLNDVKHEYHEVTKEEMQKMKTLYILQSLPQRTAGSHTTTLSSSDKTSFEACDSTALKESSTLLSSKAKDLHDMAGKEIPSDIHHSDPAVSLSSVGTNISSPTNDMVEDTFFNANHHNPPLSSTASSSSLTESEKKHLEASLKLNDGLMKRLAHEI